MTGDGYTITWTLESFLTGQEVLRGKVVVLVWRFMALFLIDCTPGRDFRKRHPYRIFVLQNVLLVMPGDKMQRDVSKL